MVYTVNGVQYTRRTKILVTGAGSGAQSNFQIKLTTIWADAMQVDYDDVRFTKADMQTLIDAWLESKTDSTTADIWAEFPTTPADGVIETKAYMYFGNTDLASDWDIEATFLFGDDFKNGLGKWNTVGTPSVVSEELILADDDRVYPLTTNRYGYNYAFRTFVKANEQDSIFIRATPDNTNTNSLTIYNSDSISNNVFTDLTTHSAKAGVANIVTTGGQSDFRTDFITYEIQRISGNASYYQDDVLIRSETNATYLPTADLGIMLQVWDSSQESTLWCDWAFVRKYVANPPTAAFGTEEHQRRTPTMM